jgi:hypothetical protein
MTDIDWLKTIAITAAGGLIVAWATWISRTVTGSLSRKEHRELCEDREKRIGCDLEEIKDMIRTNHEDANDGRSKLADKVSAVAEDVAILKARKVRSDNSEWLR